MRKCSVTQSTPLRSFRRLTRIQHRRLPTRPLRRPVSLSSSNRRPSRLLTRNPVRDLDDSCLARTCRNLGAVGVERPVVFPVRLLVVPHLGLRGIYIPVEIIWQHGLRPPVVYISGLGQRHEPAFREMPEYAPGIDRELEIMIVGASARDLVEDLDFRTVDFDVGWVRAVGRVVGVCAADVGDFYYHVGGIDLGPH